MRRSSLLVTFLCLVLLPACGKDRTAVGKEPKEKVVPVSVTTVVAGPVVRTLSTTGTFYPEEEVTVSAEVDGRIAGVFVKEGQRVAKGDLLARIEEEDFVQRVKETEAHVSLAASELARKEGLFREGLLSPQQFDEARTRVTLAEVAATLAREQLKKTSVFSPLTGAVKEKKVSAGEYVKTSTPLFFLISTDPLKLRATIPEESASRLKIGQKILVTVPAYKGEEFNGTVSMISPHVEEETRTMTFEAIVPNKQGRLLPGFFADVRIVVGAKDTAFLVPEEAVVIREKDTLLFLVKGDQAFSRSVVAGEHLPGGRVEILTGLSGGEQVVIEGNKDLTDGSKVRIVPRT